MPAAKLTIHTHASHEDAVELMGNLRPGDAREVAAVGGTVESLWDSIEHALEVFRVTEAGTDGDENGLVCIGGLQAHPEDPEQGIVWLLGTPRLDRHLLTLCKVSPEILRRWHGMRPVLTNLTDKRNRRILRWLQWLGFTFIGEYPVGAEQLPFIQFVREAHHV